MKNVLTILVVAAAVACSTQPQSDTAGAQVASALEGGQSTVEDDVSQKNIVQVAVGSADHSTLVTALKTAEYVDVLANAGPFTVFAPTNAAFEKLPAGTVEDLLKPENKDKLRDILEYHVFVGVINENMIGAERVINQVNLDNVTLKRADGKTTVNNANVLGVVPTSNGVIYVIDAVLLPPAE